MANANKKVTSQNSLNDKSKIAMRKKIIETNAKITDSSAAGRRLSARKARVAEQQAAQGKARAGGNNPVKVTNAGLKKLGSAALIAASFTPAGRVAKIVKTASTVKKASATAKAAQGAKITAQQKVTVASKTKVTALEKQIKEIEAQIKSNAARAKELANAKKAPGAPDRTSSLLDANKKLATDLKKIRQSYYDAKSTF